MPALERRDAVFVLNLGEDENRFTPDWLGEVNQLLDDVEAAAKRTAHEAMTTGRRYGGQDALAAGIVEPLAVKPAAALGIIKARMYGPVLDVLQDPTANTL